jgi:hypothetical protein
MFDRVSPVSQYDGKRQLTYTLAMTRDRSLNREDECIQSTSQSDHHPHVHHYPLTPIWPPHIPIKPQPSSSWGVAEDHTARPYRQPS